MPSASADQPPMEVNYTYVQNYDRLHTSLNTLLRSPHLLLDCEGQSIGSPDGVLSLISIGTAQAKEIFVFDVLSLCDRTNPYLRQFLNLLENPAVIKVVWDGRMDFAEVFATYGVKMQGVLDLQVAEIAARHTYEKDFQRRGRLHKIFGKKITGNLVLRPLMKDFHVVGGLQGIITGRRTVDNLAKDDEVVAMHKAGNSSFWLARPLPPKFVQYAATDIKLVSLVYEYFIHSKWITASGWNRLIQRSSRYVSYFDSRVKTQQAEEYGMCRLLPLDILIDPEPTQYQCQLCMRMLNLCCFETLVTAPAPRPTGRPRRGTGVQRNANPGDRLPPPTSPHPTGGQTQGVRPNVRRNARTNSSHRRPCCRICDMCARMKDVIIPTVWVVV